MPSFGLFYRCIRDVPFRQLLRRAQLTVARRVRVSPVGRLLSRIDGPPLPLNARLPAGIMPLRSTLAFEEYGQWFLRHLNKEFVLAVPLDWSLGCGHLPGHKSQTSTNRPAYTHLERLALHYHEFLEAIPPAVGGALILDWIRANPPWRPGYWLDSWNSYGLSIRCVCWMQWLQRHHRSICDADFEAICRSLTQQIRFLRRNLETDICGNHLMKNIRCLLWASRFFAGPEAAEWGQTGGRLLKQQLEIQFLPDGMHFELSPAYHCQIFVDLLECYVVASPEVQELLEAVLPLAASCLAALTHPDNLISLMSDGGLHMTWSPAECLETYHRLGFRPIILPERIKLSSSGYYGQRTPTTYLLVDCGPGCEPTLPAHGHADLLSFEWDVHGQRVLVDRGVFEYEAGTNRLSDRSARNHNTLTVGNRDQMEMAGSFRTGRKASAICDAVDWTDYRFRLKGHHYAYSDDSRQIIHHRSFDSDETALTITDNVDGNCSEPVMVRYLLHHNFRVVKHEGSFCELNSGSTWIRVHATAPIQLESTVWSPDFGTQIPTARLVLFPGYPPCSLTVRFEVAGSKSAPPV